MYSMKEACQQVGMTYEALKFYCNQGLIPNVKRDKNNRRIFNDQDIKWIKNLSCLKNCGMSIQEMKNYIALYLEGESTIPKRKLILEKKRQELTYNIEALNKSVDYIHWKQQFYDDIMSGKIKYKSNLIASNQELKPV